MAKAGNRQLGEAKKQKKDEFYTQLADINNELRHYEHHFKGKTVLCNCDDPRVSNFFHYFSYKFEDLGLKRLITTCYKNQERDLFSQNDSERAIWLEYNGDRNGNRIPDPEEIGIRFLKGDGDFRSAECIELLKQADIVVTNPPFSLFREYVAQLIQYGKKFIIIGNQNAINYKEIFPLIMQDKMWLGVRFNKRIGGKNMTFQVPADYPMRGTEMYEEDGKKYISVAGTGWFTNLDIKKRHEEFVFVRRYNPIDYPKYVNFDAIDVSKTADIPEDWYGMMGVPITFLDKYNPEQFEIIGQSLTLADMKVIKKLQGKAGGGPRFYVERDGKLVRLFDRIVIRRRK